VSHLPTIVAAHAKLIFPEVQNHEGLQSFFLDLSLALFDASSLDRKLIGHMKLYGKGNSKSVIKANATGKPENVQVEIRNFHPEIEVELWLNIITYKLSESALRRNFLRAFTRITKQNEVKVRSLKIEHAHDHH
jgi:hypothetical protein